MKDRQRTVVLLCSLLLFLPVHQVAAGGGDHDPQVSSPDTLTAEDQRVNNEIKSLKNMDIENKKNFNTAISLLKGEDTKVNNEINRLKGEDTNIKNEINHLKGLGPVYLTVTSTGPAGKEQTSKMGVYQQQRGQTHNGRPVWERHDGTEKLFYDNTGHWLIGDDPASDAGGVSTAEGNLQTWPHQVKGWKYPDYDSKFITDDQLTVTEGRPEYPESLTIKDETGDSPQLEGVYRRQGDSLMWKYVDYEISYNGKFWRITDDNGEETVIYGWDFYSRDHTWPNTDTLYIIDFPESITIYSTRPAAEELSFLMGRYEMEIDKSAQLRPVYKKTYRDYYIYIYYTRGGYWMVHGDITDNIGWIKSEETGLNTIPTKGWKYADGTNTWPSDPSLTFNSI